MKPGRELDALVAEKVMGWRAHSPGYPSLVDINGVPTGWLASGQGSQGDDPDFRPSTDIAAAWEVVEKISQLFKDKMIKWSDSLLMEELCNGIRIQKVDDYWKAGLTSGEDSLHGEEHPFMANRSAVGETAPHAICLAALKAVGVEV